MTTVVDVLDQLRAVSTSERDKGDRFERLMVEYFKTDRTFAHRFTDVYMWMDWPGRDGQPDTGIDLVAINEDGGVTAIQCKFYADDHSLTKSDIDSFFTASGKDPFTHRIIVSTTDHWSTNAEKAISGQKIPVQRLGVSDLENSTVEWADFSIKEPTKLKATARKSLRPHQQAAQNAVRQGFQNHDRGKMIMACGTGKTFTGLRIAEDIGPGGYVLFLVPSISLLSQSLKEWTAEADIPMRPFAVCSDARAGKRTKTEDAAPYDLVLPASTNTGALVAAEKASRGQGTTLTVIFSTYQSLAVIAEAQQNGLPDFDLVLCDEAHRTTGVTLADEDESHFVRIHDKDFIKADKRLYMTATSRLYLESSKQRAKEIDANVVSMDDEARYGPEFHHLTFGEAVEADLLTDYKVLVLAVHEDAIARTFQSQLSDSDNQMAIDDVAKIIGCLNGLAKLPNTGSGFEADEPPMQRAVAFFNTIAGSKKFAKQFKEVADLYLASDVLKQDSGSQLSRRPLRCETDHVDGTTNVLERSNKLDWLKADMPEGECRILSNARCLTEGVDVPELDAVMFLDPRSSQIDVVQAVGRVMRKSEGKKLGYVILPIVIPADMAPEKALQDNKRYKVVWQVLQALRSHDERFNALINRIDLNDGRESQIEIIIVNNEEEAPNQGLLFPFEEWSNGIYAKIVAKVGERRYWEDWAKTVAEIAQRHETRIRSILDDPRLDVADTFEQFLEALRNNLNDSITRDDAVAMISQHLITKPVFDALFSDYDFAANNPVSQVMQTMVTLLDEHALDKETAELDKFYDSVRLRAEGVDNAEGRQRVINELYEKFFRLALPKAAGALGIVYTPIEIVDFINRSVNDLLDRHFDGASISDEGVHVLDPFTGTGTFIVRLIQSGLITPADLARKYANELHCNEIMLLAYYIAAINIETAYHGEMKDAEYEPFKGIVLTDTFQMTEDGDPLDHVFFPRNNARADRQKGLDIRVIVGNPPYSVGQGSQNDDNQNLKYPTLDASIEKTYAALSTATNKNSLYDSYVRAIRWGSNRLIDTPDGGILAFVTNGGWLDANSAEGIRKTLSKEFHHIYVYNLRGNARTSGEQRRREKGNVFEAGSRNTVAVTLLVKESGSVSASGGKIHYRDIGDYLTREEKLKAVTITEVDRPKWQSISPNKHGDWINQRNANFDQLIPLGHEPNAIFNTTSRGLATGRDAWVYNSSEITLRSNVKSMITFYNAQREAFDAAHPNPHTTNKQRALVAKGFVDNDETRYSWERGDFNRMAAGERYELQEEMLRVGTYRPFFKQFLTFDRSINSMTYRLPIVYPTPDVTNPGISVVGTGNAIPFGCLATDILPQLALIGASSATHHFARWRYEKPSDENTLLDPVSTSPISNVNPAALAKFRASLGDDLNDDDLFYYVYGILHSPDFRREFETSLKKEKPRVPMVETRELFDAFSTAGRELCDLHVDYETVEPYALTEEWSEGADPTANPDLLLVGAKKMSYPKVPDPETGQKVADKTRLVYNANLTLSGIPLEAHDYILGTRSGIDWIIDRYYIKTDKASGIVNDPNQWGLERGDPRYIIELIKRVVTVSTRTVKIVDNLPTLTF